MATVTAALLMLLAAGLVATLQWARAERAREEVRRQLVASLVATGMAKVDDDDAATGLVWLVRGLALEEDARRVLVHRTRIAHVVAGLPRLVRLWSHGSGVSVLAADGGRRVASGAWDGSIRVWDVESGTAAGDWRRAAEIAALQFSPDGSRLAAGSRDGSAVVWSLADNRVEIDARHGPGPVDIVFSPDGAMAATGGADGNVTLWNVRHGSRQRILAAGGPVGRLAFSKDGRQLAAGVLAQGYRDLHDR